VKNPLEAHFWLRSVNWIMSYGEALPEIRPLLELSQRQTVPGPLSESVRSARDRALQLYLTMLSSQAPMLSRTVAATMSNQTDLRRLSFVREALEKLAKSEKDETIQNTIRNVLRTDSQAWTADLAKALKSEPLASAFRTGGGELSPTEEFLASFRYFSDYVAPELNRPQRMDERACMNCHGMPGRVPSMQLEAPDSTGYFSVDKMLKNYLTLQQRVDLDEIERSKLLRKPLNIQTGKEDGHQGGRRYVPSDRGYQIIRRWVLDQPRVVKSLKLAAGNTIQASKN
jgi:hypothetical protein